MLFTITMNPAIDKTAAVSAWKLHALNRLGTVERDVGGKGINVSKAVAMLGGKSTALGFVAGETGSAIVASLRSIPGVTPDFLTISGESRTNLKLVEPDGALTELNEAGPAATPADFERLKAKVAACAAPGDLFVLAGSALPGAPGDICRQLVSAAHAGGASVLLDVDGPQLAAALDEKPEIIKPNAYELCQYFGKLNAALPELAAMGLALNRRGIGLVCVSLGKEGALFIRAGKAIHAPGLAVTCLSSVGAGDAMAAALAYGRENAFPEDNLYRLAMAAGAAACTTSGTKPPPRETIDRLFHEVVFCEVSIKND